MAFNIGFYAYAIIDHTWADQLLPQLLIYTPRKLCLWWRILFSRCASAGFALGFIFLSPPFSPIRFFLCHFLELRARFWPFFAQKEPGLGAFFAKKCLLSLIPFTLVDYCTHIDKITKELSILYFKRLTVFKFMYILYLEIVDFS